MQEAGMVEKKSVGSAALWMREAVEAIDKQFGDGYAREHPELVADFMQAAAIDQAEMTAQLSAYGRLVAGQVCR